MRRSFHLLTCWLFATLLALALAPSPARAADGVDITRASLENSDAGYRLVMSFSFDLNRGLEDAVMRGIPLYFTIDVELTRPRWYWLDEKIVDTSQTIRISYDVLTRQYRAAISGGLQHSFNTLDDALSLVKQPGRWLITERGVLKPGETYHLAVRMALDIARLPKPFQVNALNNSDWRLSSDWKQYTFKAD